MEPRMQELVDKTDWSKTALGDRDAWPVALKTLVNVLLSSRFPMLLFWGPELICIYNDAFRPSLGKEGKHPGMLGKPGREAWEDIWPIIEPLLNQAIAGNPVWHEDLLVPFYRNGKIEEIYWTFSYSAVQDEQGAASGVMVICTETTEKVLQTQNLKDSENRFRNVVHQAPIGITILKGEDMLVEMANQTYLEIVDKKEEQLVGRRFFDVLPELRDSVEHLLLNVLRTGNPYYGTEFYIMIKRRGEIHDTYFNFVYYPLRNDNSDITGIIVVASEVTDQVRAKFTIQESEKKFRQLMMSSPVPMTILRGPEFIIENANAGMVQHIWRKRDNDIIGKKLFEVFPEFKGQKFSKYLDSVFHEGNDHSDSEAPGYIRVDDVDKHFYMDYEYTPLFDDKKVVWGVMVTINDVTEKVEARKKLEESQARLNIVIEASELGTWEVNFKTKSIAYSNRYLEILGFEGRVNVSHEEFVRHIHPDDLVIRDKAYKRAIDTGIMNYITRLIWPDGSLHWVEAKGKVFYDSDGKPDRMIGTIDDVTNERMQQDILEKTVAERTRELAQKNADLERMNAELQSFAYVSSHDLQEPLRKIQTFASRIRDIETLSPKGRDYFERMQRSAHQMQVLIQDLLAYSRTGKNEHSFEVVDLCQVVEDVRNDFQELLAEQHGKIDCIGNGPVRIIPIQFKQVMHNLISNSLKFAKPDVGPHIMISLNPHVTETNQHVKLAGNKKQFCCITLRDNGIGFDSEYKDKIFEVFQRLHGKQEYSGTGVGLAIVKRIVENHQGFIEASGVPGQGARFDIYLPAAES